MMVTPPRLPKHHPDRQIDCEMAAGEDFNKLHDQIAAAGWTPDEAAMALLSLAMNNVKARQAMAEDEAAISAARAKRNH